MNSGGGSSQKLNQFEYCFLAEDTACDAEKMKVVIPKLSSVAGGGNGTSTSSVNKSSLSNNISGVDNSVSSQQYVEVKVQMKLEHQHPECDCWNASGGKNCPNESHKNTCHHPGDSILSPCRHHHHDHHFPHDSNGMIPQGTRLICLCMSDDPSDIYVTRFICEFPSGKTYAPGLTMGAKYD